MQTAGGGPTPTPAPGTGTGAEPAGPVVELTRDLVAGLSTEARLGVTAVVALVTLVLAGVVVPRLARRVGRLLTRRVEGGPAGRVVAVSGEYVPGTVPGAAARLVGAGLVVVVGIALLAVWGLVEPARVAATTLLSGLPDLFKVGLTLLLLAVAYVGSDQLERAVERFSHGTERITEHQEEIVLRVGQLAWLVTVVAATLTLWGQDLSGLLVGAGFLGIVVGFAARQTLGSLIAGFVLMFSRPFTIGDWVEIGGDEGIVTDITIFNTRLENFDGEIVVIPNDRVSDRAVTNRSRKGMLRLRREVGIDYGNDPERAREVATGALRDVDAVVDQPAPEVVPKEFGDSAVVLELRFWIDRPTPPRKWRAISASVEAIYAAFDDAGVTIPYPQRTVSRRAADGREGSARRSENAGTVAPREED